MLTRSKAKQQQLLEKEKDAEPEAEAETTTQQPLPQRESEEAIIERLMGKTTKELLEAKAMLMGRLQIAPPGEYYGQVFMTLIRINKVLDAKQIKN